jgi:uncharacterized cupredoxin-like copper-binding protein
MIPKMAAHSHVSKVLVPVIAVASVAVIGCGGGGKSSATTKKPAATKPASSQIAAKLGEFSIKLDHATAASGNVTFSIHNGGKATHEFVVLKTDQAADALPTGADGVSEKGAGTRIKEAEDIKPGTTASLTANFARGRYVLICNLSGHYHGGMHAAFRID